MQEKEKVQTGQPEQNGEKVWREQNDPEEQKLQWQQEQIREEWKEKKLRYENLKEQQRELQPDEAEERLYERREALELAEETMKKAAEHLGERTAAGLNRRVSEIFPKLRRENIRESISVTDWKFLYGTERGGFRHTG